jgi:hypothetical protein
MGVGAVAGAVAVEDDAAGIPASFVRTLAELKQTEMNLQHNIQATLTSEHTRRAESTAPYSSIPDFRTHKKH